MRGRGSIHKPGSRSCQRIAWWALHLAPRPKVTLAGLHRLPLRAQQVVAVGASAAVGGLLLLVGAGAAWVWCSPAARRRRLHRQREGEGSAKPQGDGREASDDLVGWGGARKPRPSISTMLDSSATDTLDSSGVSNHGTPSLKQQPAADALLQHGDSLESPSQPSSARRASTKCMTHLRYIGASTVCAWGWAHGAEGCCYVQLLPSPQGFCRGHAAPSGPVHDGCS